MSRTPDLYRRCEDLGLAFIKALDIKVPVRAFSIHFEAGQYPTVRTEHFLDSVPKNGDELATQLTEFRLVPVAQCPADLPDRPTSSETEGVEHAA